MSMKKKTNARKAKKPSASAKAGAELPDLVAVMTKFVEKLDSLEKKTDFLSGRMMALPAELKLLIECHCAPAHTGHSSAQSQIPQTLSQGKILYEAVCADCCKSCKVPFRPREGRPVYCPECFAIRKAGHAPQDLVSGIKIPPTIGQAKAAVSAENPAPAIKDTAAVKRKLSPKAKKQKRTSKSRK
jgi:CxxC-x17-CxxC domain-containing protein